MSFYFTFTILHKKQEYSTSYLFDFINIIFTSEKQIKSKGSRTNVPVPATLIRRSSYLHTLFTGDASNYICFAIVFFSILKMILQVKLLTDDTIPSLCRYQRTEKILYQKNCHATNKSHVRTS